MAGPAAVVKSLLLGRPKETARLHQERLTKRIALAVFSSDALSSSAYATEEMLLILILAGATALRYAVPLSLTITLVLGIVIFSYRQTVRAYPAGASAYIVASDNLGTHPGLVAASALLIDYVLTVAVSIAAGVAALISMSPGLADLRVPIALAAIGLVTVLNLRGVRESGVIFAIPTYAYITLITATVAVGLIRYATGFRPDLAPTALPPDQLQPLTLFLILRAYSHGSTALTGVEAISDGVGAFKEPVARNAAMTLLVMGGILGTMFMGLTVLSRLYEVTGPTQDPDRTVVALIALRIFGNSPIFFAVQIATALILFLAANTSFADFPRLSYFLARDRFFPRQFMNRGDRLAFSNGIIALGAFAAVLTVIFGAEVSRIINLYVVGVFTSFTLSQSGMVRRWYRLRRREPRWRRNATVNGLGAVTTFLVLCIVLATRFTHGAWIVVCAVPILIYLMKGIHAHYLEVGQQLRDPARRPAPAQRNHVILLVGGPSREEARAFAYAQRIQTEDFRCVHFAERGDPKGLEAQWARQLGLLPTTPALEIVPADGSLTTVLRTYIQRLRERIPPGDFVTVIVSERVKQGTFFTLGTRTGLLLKTALLFTPDVVTTDVPYLENVPQTALELGRPTRHIVVLLAPAAHNATLHALEYANTLSADEVRAVHVVLDPEMAEHHRQTWDALGTGRPLELVESAYRDLGDAVRDYVRSVAGTEDTIVTVLLPEFIVSKWWQHILHNQNAFDVKWTLLREPNVVVTSVPYRLA